MEQDEWYEWVALLILRFVTKTKKLSRTQELAELKMPYRQQRMEGLSYDSCTHAFMAFRHY